MLKLKTEHREECRDGQGEQGWSGHSTLREPHKHPQRQLCCPVLNLRSNQKRAMKGPKLASPADSLVCCQETKTLAVLSLKPI